MVALDRKHGLQDAIGLGFGASWAATTESDMPPLAHRSLLCVAHSFPLKPPRHGGRVLH